MSSVMVDFRSPASASLKLHTDRPGSVSSIKGRIPSSSSHPLFNSSSILESSLNVDRGNLGHRVSATFSASPSPPCFPFFLHLGEASADPEAVSAMFPTGKEAFRRFSCETRGHHQNGGAATGFHPFRSVFPGENHIDRVEDCRTQSVQEQLYGWKPFVPDASSWLSSGIGFLFGDAVSGSNESSCKTGPGSIQNTTFCVVNNGRGNTGT